MARKQRAQPTRPGPAGGGRRRGGRMGDRYRPRKYTRINVEDIDYKDLTTSAAVHLGPRQDPLAAG